MEKIIFVDPEHCSGCRICEAVCSFSKTGTIRPSASRIKVQNWFVDGISVPIVCLNCETPYCAAVCPTKAIYKDGDGIVHLEKDKCINCKKCIQACPFGAIGLDPELNEIIKCDLCGGDALCTQFCPTDALIFVEPTRIGEINRRKRMLKQANAQYGLEETVRTVLGG